MKQFQKYGVAAAVATVASGAVAQMMSPNETGDMAIVPYYTVNDGKNTGIHIINTTPELRSSRYACVAALIPRTLSTSTS